MAFESPAGAGAHSGKEHELRPPRSPLAGPGDPEDSLFHRLPKRTEYIAPEIRQLVKDEDPTMGKLHFARPLAEAEEPPQGACRARDADRRQVPVGAQFRSPSVGGIDFTDFFLSERRQEARELADGSGLPGARGTDEEKMVAAGKRYLKGMTRILVPKAPGEIGNRGFDVLGSH